MQPILTRRYRQYLSGPTKQKVELEWLRWVAVDLQRRISNIARFAGICTTQALSACPILVTLDGSCIHAWYLALFLSQKGLDLPDRPKPVDTDSTKGGGTVMPHYPL